MRRGKPKVIKETLHKYFTRQNKQQRKPESFSSDGEASSSMSTTTMAHDDGEDYTNAELRKLIVGFKTSMDSQLKDGFGEINEKISNLTTKFENLEEEVETVKKAQSEDRAEIQNLAGEVNTLRQSLLHSQVHSRKYNLLIYGLEGYETTPSATIDKIRKFAVENLKLDEQFANRMAIRNAHRLQRREGRTTPIIAVFLFWTERDTFLRAGRNLAGTKMQICTDLPPELKQKRGQLAHKAFEIRRDEKLPARVTERGVTYGSKRDRTARSHGKSVHKDIEL
jgi:hypothetical protein